MRTAAGSGRTERPRGGWITAAAFAAAAACSGGGDDVPLSAHRQAVFASGANLIGDPGFESGTAGFTTSHAAVTLDRETGTPIAGTASLKVAFTGWGQMALHERTFPWNSGDKAVRLTGEAKVKVTAGPAGTPIAFCVVAEYQQAAGAPPPVTSCQDVPADARHLRTDSLDAT